MPLTINGKKGAYLQPTKYGLNESGRYTVFTWEGTQQECLANVPVIEAAGGLWEMQESFTQAKCVLTGYFPNDTSGTEKPINSWEFFASTAEKEIFEADNLIVEGITTDDKKAIQAALENPEGEYPALNSPAPYDAYAAALFLRMQNGLRAFRVPVPTLRHTQTVSNVYAVQQSLQNIGRIITTASLKTLEAIPSNLIWQLPDQFSARDGLAYGWFKMHPTIRVAARQKTQIEQEWEYGLWTTKPPLYGAFI